nr:hypothetical protein [Haloglomus sp. DT116]
MLAVYRHDTHKFNGRTHDNALEEFAGVEVNQQVPCGADGDAAALSRPLEQREPVVPTHRSPYRLSLLTGNPVHETGETAGLNVAAEVEDLITFSEADVAHEQWLQSDVAAMYNEAVAFPYTSLKYHTLLVAALLHHYRDGQGFGDLRLVVDEAETIVPHRTVYAGEQFSLRIATDDGRPSARFGSRLCRSWASTWNRLTDHPLRTDEKKWDMTLDANLRRIRAWSTALQYIEDFQGGCPDR